MNFDGSELTRLTPEQKNHLVTLLPGERYFLDEVSDHATPAKFVMRDIINGDVVMVLGNTDASELVESGWLAPEPFTMTAKDGETTIYGVMYKPSDFDPSKRYPVIDYTYSKTTHFPNRFSKLLGWSGRNNRALAELGFIVVTIDGLGSPNRSKAFEDSGYSKLGYGLEDHVLAIQELGRRYPWLDAERVGVYGHSAGGYDTAQALLRFPDFYKVGFSTSADHDHRMEKAWWPEMYMGWPVAEHYHQQSNITMAENLKGKLMLVHGGIDENVNPSATYKLADALVKADKEFDLIILPNQRHHYHGQYGEYITKKRWNYFIEHLQGREPIWPIKFDSKETDEG